MRGFTLSELLIAMALVGVLGLAVAQLTVYLLKATRHRTTSVSRDQVVVSTRETAGDLKALKLSLKKPENAKFHDCVCGGGSACASTQMVPLNLYDSAGVLISPRFFDSEGNACEPTSTNCLIRVQTDFLAECMPILPSANPVPPATCTTPAEFIAVVVTVDQNPATLSQASIIRAHRSGVFTQISDLAPIGSGVCP